jgi:hypothetical protein
MIEAGSGAADASALADFRSAGRALLSMGLVKGSEGNLSTYDGEILTITRTGSALGALEASDLLTGGLDGALPDASSDLEVHRRMYRDRGSGAVAHAHPPGTVPEDGGGPGAHGAYEFAPTLAGAVEAVVAAARAGTAGGSGR